MSALMAHPVDIGHLTLGGRCIMDTLNGLHNAARKYCFELFSRWARTNFQGVGRSARLIRAILDDVESLSPSDFSSPKELRQMLLAAGETAQDEWLGKGLSEREQHAFEAERQRFCKFITGLDEEACTRGAQLPFRRVLKETEAKSLGSRFVQTWGTWYGGYCNRQDIPPNVTLHTDAMATSAAYGAIRKVLRAKNFTRIYELREWGHSYEMDVDLADFQYTGAEGFWFTNSLEWMITASHEASITFGADWLVRAMRECLPDFDRYIYKGWHSGAY